MRPLRRQVGFEGSGQPQPPLRASGAPFLHVADLWGKAVAPNKKIKFDEKFCWKLAVKFPVDSC